jgi:hypothetical protein
MERRSKVQSEGGVGKPTVGSFRRRWLYPVIGAGLLLGLCAVVPLAVDWVKTAKKKGAARSPLPTRPHLDVSPGLIRYTVLEAHNIGYDGGEGRSMDILVAESSTKAQAMALASALLEENRALRHFKLGIYDSRKAWKAKGVLTSPGPDGITTDYPREEYERHFLVEAYWDPKISEPTINWWAFKRNH